MTAEPRLTEAEYLALLPVRIDAVVASINDRMHAAGVLPADMRFEWADPNDHQ